MQSMTPHRPWLARLLDDARRVSAGIVLVAATLRAIAHMPLLAQMASSTFGQMLRRHNR